MRPHKIYLQFPDLLTGNSHIAQLSHSSCDGIRDFVAGDNLIDHRTRAVYSLASIRS
jgi:hypothetical protein